MAQGGRHMYKYLPPLAGLTFSSIFGFSFFFTKEALEYVDPIALLGYRFFTATLLLTILYLFRVIKLSFLGKKKGVLLLLALFQPILYFSFETTGVKLTSASESGLMISLIPVFVTLLAIFFLKEKPSMHQVFFILLSVFGVFIILLLKDQLLIESNLTGYLFLGGAVLMAAIYNVLSRHLSLKYTPLEMTLVMMWSGALVFNALALYHYKGNVLLYLNPLRQREVLFPVLYLGIFSSVVAFFLINYTLSKLKAFQSAVFSNLTTIIAVLAGVIFRGETFYHFQIIGGLLIIMGVFGTNYLNQTTRKKGVNDPLQ